MVKNLTFTSSSGQLETTEVVTVDENYYALVLTLRQLIKSLDELSKKL